MISPTLHDGPLVDVGVLVRTRVLDEVVDIDTDLAGDGLARHSLAPRCGWHRCNRPPRRAAPAPRYPSPPPPCARYRFRPALSPGRRQGTAWRCMFAPINARLASSCSRNGISDAATDTIWPGATSMYCDRVRRLEREFALVAARHQLVEQPARLVELGVGLGDDVMAFLDRRQKLDLVGHLAVCHLAIRRLEEAVVVGAGDTRPAS